MEDNTRGQDGSNRDSGPRPASIPRRAADAALLEVPSAHEFAEFLHRAVRLGSGVGNGVDFYAAEDVIVKVEASDLIPFEGFDDLDYWTLSLGLRDPF